MPTSLGRPLTVREVHALWKRRAAGETVSSLARELGCTTSNLRLRWKKAGIDIRDHRVPRTNQHPQWNLSYTIWTLRTAGVPFEAIADQLGEEDPTSLRTLNRLQMRLRRYCVRVGIPYPKQHGE